MHIKRGEVWLVNLDPTLGSEIKKTRPALVLSVDPINRARRTVVIVPLSSSAIVRPPLVIATPSMGVSSVAVCDQVRTVDKQRFSKCLGVIKSEEMSAVAAGVAVVLGIVVP